MKIVLDLAEMRFSERHPDNVAAALYGGFVATYVDDLDAQHLAEKDLLWNEIIPSSSTELDIRQRPNVPPIGIGHSRSLPWAKEIKALVVIPNYEVPTSKARDILPQVYTRADIVRHNALDSSLATS